MLSMLVDDVDLDVFKTHPLQCAWTHEQAALCKYHVETPQNFCGGIFLLPRRAFFGEMRELGATGLLTVTRVPTSSRLYRYCFSEADAAALFKLRFCDVRAMDLLSLEHILASDDVALAAAGVAVEERLTKIGRAIVEWRTQQPNYVQCADFSDLTGLIPLLSERNRYAEMNGKTAQDRLRILSIVILSWMASEHCKVMETIRVDLNI